jgi:hypothetical protein
MSSLQVTTPSGPDGSTPTVVPLVDTAGGDGPACRAPDNEEARTDQALVLFMVLDVLIGSFRSQLLALGHDRGDGLLPLSFLAGYFGMNFRILTSDVQTSLWQFLLLGLLLPIASAAFSLLLIHPLQWRFGVSRARRD